MLKRFNHSTEVVQEGEKFDIKLCTGFMTKEWKFTVGEDFEEKPMGWSNDLVIVSIQRFILWKFPLWLLPEYLFIFV